MVFPADIRTAVITGIKASIKSADICMVLSAVFIKSVTGIRNTQPRHNADTKERTDDKDGFDTLSKTPLKIEYSKRTARTVQSEGTTPFTSLIADSPS